MHMCSENDGRYHVRANGDDQRKWTSGGYRESYLAPIVVVITPTVRFPTTKSSINTESTIAVVKNNAFHLLLVKLPGPAVRPNVGLVQDNSQLKACVPSTSENCPFFLCFNSYLCLYCACLVFNGNSNKIIYIRNINFLISFNVLSLMALLYFLQMNNFSFNFRVIITNSLFLNV